MYIFQESDTLETSNILSYILKFCEQNKFFHTERRYTIHKLSWMHVELKEIGVDIIDQIRL